MKASLEWNNPVMFDKKYDHNIKDITLYDIPGFNNNNRKIPNKINSAFNTFLSRDGSTLKPPTILKNDDINDYGSYISLFGDILNDSYFNDRYYPICVDVCIIPAGFDDEMKGNWGKDIKQKQHVITPLESVLKANGTHITDNISKIRNDDKLEYMKFIEGEYKENRGNIMRCMDKIVRVLKKNTRIVIIIDRRKINNKGDVVFFKDNYTKKDWKDTIYVIKPPNGYNKLTITTNIPKFQSIASTKFNAMYRYISQWCIPQHPNMHQRRMRITLPGKKNPKIYGSWSSEYHTTTISYRFEGNNKKRIYILSNGGIAPLNKNNINNILPIFFVKNKDGLYQKISNENVFKDRNGNDLDINDERINTWIQYLNVYNNNKNGCNNNSQLKPNI